MTRTERTLWPLAAALLLLASGCARPGDAGAAAAAGPTANAGPAAADAESAVDTVPRTPGHGAHADHGPSVAPAATKAADHSVYLLPSSWRDASDAHVALDDLAGRVQVVAMVYTHCSFACPRILAQMKRIEAGVGDAGHGDRVGFTLVSLEPERDTPGRLADFAGSLRLDPERWTLLTGSDDDVRALSVLLGVKYRANADGGIDHSNIITVLDEDGVPIHRVEGLDADTDPALRAILERVR